MVRTPLDKDGWGSGKEGGGRGTGAGSKEPRQLLSPPHALNSKEAGVQNSTLINCKQKGAEWREDGREGWGGARLWFGKRDQHIGPNDVIHQDGHCNLPSISSSIKLERS